MAQGGGSPDIKRVRVPFRNFHDKPLKIPVNFFVNHLLTPKRYQNLNS